MENNKVNGTVWSCEGERAPFIHLFITHIYTPTSFFAKAKSMEVRVELSVNECSLPTSLGRLFLRKVQRLKFLMTDGDRVRWVKIMNQALEKET